VVQEVFRAAIGLGLLIRHLLDEPGI